MALAITGTAPLALRHSQITRPLASPLFIVRQEWILDRTHPVNDASLSGKQVGAAYLMETGAIGSGNLILITAEAPYPTARWVHNIGNTFLTPI